MGTGVPPRMVARALAMTIAWFLALCTWANYDSGYDAAAVLTGMLTMAVLAIAVRPD